MSRSFLFIPGDVPRMLQNMDVFDADAIIIDFEDSVASHEKDEARALTRAFLSRYKVAPLVYVRINAFDEEEEALKDLEALRDLPITGIVLPKISAWALEKLNQTQYAGLVIGIVETPSALFELYEIAKNSSVEGLILGAEDLTKSLEINRTTKGDELLFARSQIIYACAATNKLAIDTPFTHVLDSEGLAFDIKQAVTLGMKAKCAIHPNHVYAINEAFSPSLFAIEEATRIVMQSEKLNSSRFSLDGKMIDKPVIERAKSVLKRAARYQRGQHDETV